MGRTSKDQVHLARTILTVWKLHLASSEHLVIAVFASRQGDKVVAVFTIFLLFSPIFKYARLSSFSSQIIVIPFFS